MTLICLLTISIIFFILIEPGPVIISLEDVSDFDSDTFLPLKIIRQYSSNIHKRRTFGPMGKGWVVPIL